MEFKKKLNALIDANKSLVCVGLDPDLDKLPAKFLDSATPLFDFNKEIIDATADLVCAFKPNSAFYEAYGADGITQLKQTCDYITEKYPTIPIILDFKRGDIGNTNDNYAKFAFEFLRADAVTVQPYQGQTAVQSFLDHKDKGIIVLCRTSNEGSDEFQNLEAGGEPLYLRVAQNVSEKWNDNNNCLLVVGATAPDELKSVRQAVGDEMTILVPGIGAQGGDTQKTMEAGINSFGRGLIICSSRAIIYASSEDDFSDKARAKTIELSDEVNKYRGM